MLAAHSTAAKPSGSSASQRWTTPQAFVPTAGSGSDDWPAIQLAIDAVAAQGGGTVVLGYTPSGYNLGQALRWRSNVKVDAENATVYCNGNATYSDESVGLPAGGLAMTTDHFPLRSCAMFGSVQTSGYALVTAIPLQTVNVGDQKLAPPPGSAKTTASICKGDVVFVEENTHYNLFAGDGNHPTYYEANVVTSRNPLTGEISLRYPTERAIVFAEVRDVARNGQYVNSVTYRSSLKTGVPWWATHDAALIGGTWISQTQFMTVGGAIDCTIRPSKVISMNSALSENALHRCEIDIPVLKTGNVALELAFGSAHNHVELDHIEATGLAITPRIVPAVIDLDEGTHDNDVEANVELSASSVSYKYVLEITHAYNNEVTIHSLSGAGVAGSTAKIWGEVPTSGTGAPPDTSKNIISFQSSRLNIQASYVDMSTKYVNGNEVIGSNFTGAVTSGKSLVFDVGIGLGNIMERVSAASGTPNCGTAGNRFSHLSRDKDETASLPNSKLDLTSEASACVEVAPVVRTGRRPE